MKEGRRPKDELSVAAALARATERAAALERTDALAAYENFRRLAREFDGLADASPFARKSTELKDSKSVREGRTRQEGEFRRTKELWEELGRTVLAVRAHTEERPRILLELRSRAEDLYRQAEGSKDPRRAIVIRRALASAFAFAIEEGSQQLRQKNYVMAAVNFEAAGEINPRIPWPFYSLARTHALMGDRKRCFRALGKAADTGMRNAALLREAPEFAAWRDDPEFLKLVKRVEANAQQPQRRP